MLSNGKRLLFFVGLLLAHGANAMQTDKFANKGVQCNDEPSSVDFSRVVKNRTRRFDQVTSGTHGGSATGTAALLEADAEGCVKDSNGCVPCPCRVRAHGYNECTASQSGCPTCVYWNCQLGGTGSTYLPQCADTSQNLGNDECGQSIANLGKPNGYAVTCYPTCQQKYGSPHYSRAKTATLKKSDVECIASGGEEYLGAGMCTASECATLVDQKGGKFFIWGKSGKWGNCWWEKTTSGCTSSGESFTTNQYDFYEVDTSQDTITFSSGMTGLSCGLRWDTHKQSGTTSGGDQLDPERATYWDCTGQDGEKADPVIIENVANGAVKIYVMANGEKCGLEWSGSKDSDDHRVAKWDCTPNADPLTLEDVGNGETKITCVVSGKKCGLEWVFSMKSPATTGAYWDCGVTEIDGEIVNEIGNPLKINKR